MLSGHSTTSILFFFVLSPVCFSQEKPPVDHQQLAWVRYQIQGTFGPKWTAELEADWRQFLPDFTPNQHLYRSQVRRLLRPGLELGLGCVYSERFAQQPSDTKPAGIPEIRPETNVLFRRSWSKFEWRSRLQLEDRITRSSTERGSVWNPSWRTRLRIALWFTPGKNASGPLRFTVSNECMWQYHDQVRFDQNRLYIGAWLKISPITSVEMGFMKILQQQSSPGFYFNRDVVRFSLYQKFKFESHD